MRPVPLFMTRFSHSPKTAIGVQTALLMEPFEERLLLYWSTPTHYPNSARVRRLENPLVARIGALQRPGPLQRLAHRARLGWWDGDVLRGSKRKAVERLREGVSHMYVAPIDGEDAARMRHLVEALDRPFVLHLWDCLTGPMGTDPNLVWLVQHARKVLALSRPLLEDVERFGAEGEILLFTRRPAQVRAQVPTRPGEPIKIALLGLLDPYLDGVVALDQAIDRLAAQGVTVEPVFIGTQKAADRINGRLTHKVVGSGFLSNEERDARLASCQFGFVPGPMQDPQTDMRSRYSIPSRSLDYLAVGLPSIGTVHPESATGWFYRGLGLTEDAFCTDAESIVEAITRLSPDAAWEKARERSEVAFEKLRDDPPPQKLRRVMDAIVSDT